MLGNLLNLAHSIIPTSTFQVQKYSGTNTVSEIGFKIPIFNAPVDVEKGIVEAVENAAYRNLGLEFGKNYIQAWSSVGMLGLDRQEVADQIIYNGMVYNVEKSTDWVTYNEWGSVIAVEDKKA